MRKIVILMFLLVAVIISAGCNEKTQASGSSVGGQGDSKISTGSEGIAATTAGMQNISVPAQGSQDAGTVEEVTQLEQVNASLQKGPVLLKIGSEQCVPCQDLKPVLKDLAKEYAGKVTIMSIDADKNPKLSDYFSINYIPDTTMILGIENGEYVYMHEDGQVTKDRIQARIIGLKYTEESKNKEMFENVLNLALQHENTKST
jgi:thioredoxin 1